ncbi:hypothetical protein [Sphingomonas sp. SRS2]|uniref:hypothetical protein n=1 Tax=Sphingomonas sp. SRS2 TaxID=133190 RepID=UPI00061842EF|nr:hypothetical protein [Sphingomonas sp. SRS2]KKC25830.1 hypothetical protein WP12_12315 [Sphingomonas sp. SRS2]
MIVKTKRLTRQQLEEFLPNNRAIRAFESVQDDVIGTGSVLADAPIITIAEDADLPASRVLTGSDNVSIDDGGAGEPVILDLTDTGVDAGSYGSTTRILIIGLDSKGRVTSAEAVKIDVSDVDGILMAANGGTGLDAYAVGDLLVANAADALAPLPDVATGNVLRSGGVGAIPAYGKVDLTTDVSGVLPAANGGYLGGFSGTGAYTNFTFTNGRCTAAS